MEATQSMFNGMTFEDAVSVFGEGNTRYRITINMGRAEAAELQRRAGNGDVTNEGYVRETNCDFIADCAAADPDATVEEI